MDFAFLDHVLELSPQRIVTSTLITGDEDYLRDHFESFPVLPGVLMLEAMLQAARRLAEPRPGPLVLGRVRALKYGRFVHPGETLRVEVTLLGELDARTLDFKGECTVDDADAARTAASGRFTLRPIRVGTLPGRARG